LDGRRKADAASLVVAIRKTFWIVQQNQFARTKRDSADIEDFGEPALLSREGGSSA